MAPAPGRLRPPADATGTSWHVAGLRVDGRTASLVLRANRDGLPPARAGGIERQAERSTRFQQYEHEAPGAGHGAWTGLIRPPRHERRREAAPRYARAAASASSPNPVIHQGVRHEIGR